MTEKISEKTISLRLPERMVELLKFLGRGKGSMSEIARDRLDAGLKTAEGKLQLNQDVWHLQEDAHLTMSRLLEKLYDNPELLRSAEFLFMARFIQQECYSGRSDISVRRYFDLLSLVGQLYDYMIQNGFKVDEHYLRTKLKVGGQGAGDVPIQRILEQHRQYCYENNRSLDTDGLARALLCLAEDSWQIEDTQAFRRIVTPHFETLFVVSSRPIFKNKPYAIGDSRTFLTGPLSERRVYGDFGVSVYNIQGFACVIDMPHALITTGFEGFHRLLHMKGLLSAPQSPLAFLPFIDGVRLSFRVEDVEKIKGMLQEIAAHPGFAAENKLLALAHGVAE